MDFVSLGSRRLGGDVSKVQNRPLWDAHIVSMTVAQLGIPIRYNSWRQYQLTAKTSQSQTFPIAAIRTRKCGPLNRSKRFFRELQFHVVSQASMLKWHFAYIGRHLLHPYLSLLPPILRSSATTCAPLSEDDKEYARPTIQKEADTVIEIRK